MHNDTIPRLLELITEALEIADDNGLAELGIAINRVLVLLDGAGASPLDDADLLLQQAYDHGCEHAQDEHP